MIMLIKSESKFHSHVSLLLPPRGDFKFIGQQTTERPERIR